MYNIPIKVSAHTSLNSSKGVKRSRDLEGVSEDEMLENLSSQGVSVVKRIHIRRDNELVPTNTFILTFCKPLLPDSIKTGYLKIPIVPFIPNPLRCFKCHRYGHGEKACHVLDVVKLTTRVKHVPMQYLVPIARSVLSGNKKNRYNKLEWKHKCHSLKPDNWWRPCQALWLENTDLTWPNGADRLNQTNLILRRHINKQKLFRSSGHLLHHRSLWII